MIAITRGTAFALCLSQVAVTALVIMYYPPVHIQLFTNHCTVINGTLTDNTCLVYVADFGLGVPFLMLSCVAVLFSTTTANLGERGPLSQGNLYSYEVLVETGPWDYIFWLFCLGAHALVIAVIMSPGDVFAVLLSTLLTVYFLGRLCSPRSCQLSMTQENFGLLGYCAGLAVAAYNVPDAHSGRSAALLLTVLLDYMLGMGHTWEQQPPMDTVTNCRLFWVCGASVSLAALYGAWHDHLLLG
jgi:hypothetical protein